MSTEGQDYSVLLWEVIDHWKTKPAPSKCDGHESEGAIPSINMMQGWKLQGKWHNEPSLGLINRIKVSGLVRVAENAVASWVVEINPY